MIPAPPPPNDLTIISLRKVFPGDTNRILVDASISRFDPGDLNNPIGVVNKTTRRFSGIFDTGASRTVISEELAKNLALKPIGKLPVSTANGVAMQDRHVVNIVLPMGIVLSRQVVTAAKLRGLDFLLGMDIIGMGDFTITTHRGFKVATFSIYIPVYQPPPPPPSGNSGQV